MHAHFLLLRYCHAFKAPPQNNECSQTAASIISEVLRCGVECTEAGRGVLVCRAADRQIDAVFTPLRDDE